MGCPIAIKRDVLELLQVKSWTVFLSNSFQDELFYKGPWFLGPLQVLVWPAGDKARSQAWAWGHHPRVAGEGEGSPVLIRASDL